MGLGDHYIITLIYGCTLSHVALFVVPWTGAYQAPLSMGFSRQEYWSGVPLPSPYDLAIPLLSIHTEENRIERDTCTPMFIAALFFIVRTWKQPDKKAVVHMHNGVLFSH